MGRRSGPRTGREAVRPFYERVVGDTEPEGVTPLRRLYGDGFVVDELEWTGWVTFRMPHVFEVAGDPIASEAVYVDSAAIAAQLSR